MDNPKLTYSTGRLGLLGDVDVHSHTRPESYHKSNCSHHLQLGLYTKCSGDRADARRCNDPDCKAGHPMFSIVGNGSTKTVEKAFKQRDGHIGSLVVKIQRIPDEDVVTPVDKDAWIKSTKLISITPIECFHLRPRKEATVKKVVEGGSMQVCECASQFSDPMCILHCYLCCLLFEMVHVSPAQTDRGFVRLCVK